MSRVAKILTRVRDSLADPDADRWSNARLIRLFNEAMLDCATQTRFLRGYVELVVYDGVAEYDLPADLWEISRLAYNNAVLPVRSMQEMDVVRKDMWITDRAPQPECAVHNAGGMSKVRLYPIPDSQASNVEGDGVTTSFTSPYGLLTEVEDSVGVVTEVSESTGGLQIWYVKTPATLDDTLATWDDPDLPALFDTAIKHYIVGVAFNDDIDQRNTQMGAIHLQLFERELSKLKSLGSRSRRADADAFTVPYRTGFN